MKKIDVILSQSVEDDLLLLLSENKIDKFSVLPTVMGQGESIPKMGNSVWPQLNCWYCFYMEDDKVETLRGIINQLRDAYPKEGIAAFVSAVEMM